jgi:CheY-like chemotaxis protein
MKKILVVDDQPDCSEPMARLLELCGFEPRVAGDGKAALEMVEPFGPDLILLDLSMPGMDGFDFLRVLRGIPRWANLPVIVFSAIYNEKMHTGLRLLGVNDVFSKGETDFDILIRRIGEVSGETEAAAGAQRKILLVEDDGETRMALERLLRDYGYEVSGVESAADAVREAEGKQFDLAVVDLGLDDGEGITLLEGLLGKGGCKSLGLNWGEKKVGSGFSKLLKKPVPVDELMETIRGLTD